MDTRVEARRDVFDTGLKPVFQYLSGQSHEQANLLLNAPSFHANPSTTVPFPLSVRIGEESNYE
jgi:hypothetical protein